MFCTYIRAGIEARAQFSITDFTERLKLEAAIVELSGFTTSRFQASRHWYFIADRVDHVQGAHLLLIWLWG